MPTARLCRRPPDAEGLFIPKPTGKASEDLVTFEIRSHHLPDQFPKSSRGAPSELFLSFGRIADQQIDFRGAVEARIYLDILPVIQIGLGESQFAKFPDRMGSPP